MADKRQRSITVRENSNKGEVLLKCYYQNVKGLALNTVTTLLRKLQSEAKWRVIILTETSLTNSKDDELVLDGYKIVRRDTQDRWSSGGGILIIYEDKLDLRVIYNSADCKAITAEIPCESYKYYVSVLYLPPKTKIKELRRQLNCIDLVGYDKYVLLGEFNLPNMKSSELTISLKEGRLLCSLDPYNFIQKIEFTYNKTGLTLLFSTEEINARLTEGIFSFNDKAFEFDINVGPCSFKSPDNLRGNFIKANWGRCLQEISETALTDWKEKAGLRIERLLKKLWDIFTRNAHIVYAKGSNYDHSLEKEYIEIVQDKDDFRDKGDKYRQGNFLSKRESFEISETEDEIFKFDKMLKNLANPESDCRSLFSIYLREVIEPQCVPEKVTCRVASASTEEHADKFEESLITPLSSFECGNQSSVRYYGKTLSDGFNLSVSEEDVVKAIDELETLVYYYRPDLPTVFYKKAKPAIVPILHELYTHSLNRNIFPQIFKTAIVHVKHTKQSVNTMEDYSPTLYTPNIVRILERILMDKIVRQSQTVISGTQHGFTENRSKLTNLLAFWSEVTKEKCQTDAIYISFTDAFDSVTPTTMVNKLRRIGFPENLLKWLECYLTDRKQIIYQENKYSSKMSLGLEFLKWSTFGRLLMTLYLNDLPDFLRKHSPFIDVLLFEDKLKLFNRIRCEKDCLKLNEAMGNVHKWCQSWETVANFQNIHVITFISSKKSGKILYTYRFNEIPVNRVAFVNDLGVRLTSNCDLVSHITNRIIEANRTLGQILRVSKDNVIELFQLLVLPVIHDYSHLWSGNTKNIHEVSNEVEEVQKNLVKRLVRRSGDSYKESEYNNYLTSFKLRKLSDLRYKMFVEYLSQSLSDDTDCHLAEKIFIAKSTLAVLQAGRS